MLKQRVHQGVQLVLLLPQNTLRLVVQPGQNGGDFPVDLCGGLFAVFAALAEFHADENFLVAAQVDRADVVAHAELRHHLPGDFRRPLQVAAGSGVDLAQGDLFRRVSAQHHRHLVKQLRAAHVVVFLLRQGQRVSGCLSPGNDGNQVHFVAALQQMAHDGVSAFVIGHHPLVVLAHLVALLFRAHLHPGNRVDQQLLVDFLLPGPGAQNRRFVHHVFQVRAGGKGHPLRNVVQIHVRRQLLAAAVHLQNRDPPALVGIVHRHLPVKPARTQQRGVQNIPPVRGRHHDDAFVHRETVHFNQQLVQRLLPFVVAAAEARAAVTSDGVDFVDENNRRGYFLRLFKKVAHATGADADKHFNKVAAADGEEGHARLSGNRLGQQGFARSGRAHQQHALGNPRADFRIVLRVLQEVDHFLKFFLLLVRACNVGKGHLVLGRILHPGPAAAEGHDPSVAAALGAHHQEPDHRHDAQHDQVRNKLVPPGNRHRRPVFNGKVQVVDRNVGQLFPDLVGLHLANGFDKVVPDRRLKVIAPLREIGVRRHGNAVFPVKDADQ